MPDVMENPAEVEQTEAEQSPGADEQQGEAKAEAAAEGAGSDASTDDADNGAERRRQNGVEKRIARLTAEKYNALEEAQRLRAKLDAMERGQQQQAEAPAADPAKPRKDQFASDEDYLEAVVEYRLTKERGEREVAQKVEQFTAKISRAQAEIPDFNDVVPADIQAGPGVVQALFTVEEPGLVLYQLGQDSKLLDRLNRMSAIEAASKIGELHAQILAKRKAPEPQRTDRRAPAPPSKIATGAAYNAQSDGPPPDATDAEYAAWWRRHHGIT